MKTSTSLARELDFQGLAGFGSVFFGRFWGFGFWMALGMDFCDLGMDFGSILASKIDEKRDRFRELFLKVLWRGPAEINSLGKSPGEVDN